MNPLSFSALRLFLSVTVLICASFALAGCSRGVVRETAAETRIEKPKPPGSPMWLGNPERNFYGTGPLKNGALRIVWEAETDFIKGRLHKDPWGGSSWPGQPSINGDRVYFPSADGYVYCLNKNDGSVIWKFRGKDSMKATPVILDRKILASGLDHHLYCLNAGDGSVIWDYETGFEVDGSTIVVGDRVYFGGEDHYFYCLNLADGALVYKVLVGFVRCYKQDTGELVWNFVTDGGHLGNANEHIGIWASPILANGNLYVGASNHYLYCLTAAKGELVWKYKARGPIWGTSPVIDGRVVFGDKAGWVQLLSANDGKLISELKIGDNVNATPAVLDGRIYIGAFNGKLYCLELDPTSVEQSSPTVAPRGLRRKR